MSTITSETLKSLSSEQLRDLSRNIKFEMKSRMHPVSLLNEWFLSNPKNSVNYDFVFHHERYPAAHACLLSIKYNGETFFFRSKDCFSKREAKFNTARKAVEQCKFLYPVNKDIQKEERQVGKEMEREIFDERSERSEWSERDVIIGKLMVKPHIQEVLLKCKITQRDLYELPFNRNKKDAQGIIDCCTKDCFNGLDVGAPGRLSPPLVYRCDLCKVAQILP